MLAIILSICVVVCSATSGLYLDDPYVIEIQNASLRVLHPNATMCPWIVLLYDASCGHCRAYQPKFSKIAKEFHESQQSPLIFTAVNCGVSSWVTCKAFEVPGVPALRVAMPIWQQTFKPDPLNSVKDSAFDWKKISHGKDEEQEFREISSSMAPDIIQTCQEISKTLLQRIPAATPILGIAGNEILATTQPTTVFHEDDSIHLTDIANSLFHTLHHEVPFRFPLPAHERNILFNFLSAITLSIPQLHTDIILAALEQHKNSTVDASSWKRILRSAKIPIMRQAPDHFVWRTCKGSESRYRGFPCGLWLLYHSMLSNAPAMTGIKTLEALRNYILTFFLCNSCRQHFGMEPMNLPVDGSDKSAILWLFDVHNRVNQRLALSRSTDPKVPKNIFPSLRQCPSCRKMVGSRQEDEITQYLKLRYAVDNYEKSSSEVKELLKNMQSTPQTHDFQEKNSVKPLWSMLNLVVTVFVLSSIIVTLKFFFCRNGKSNKVRRFHSTV